MNMDSLLYLNPDYFLYFNIGLITLSVIFFVIIDVKSNIIDSLKSKLNEISTNRDRAISEKKKKEYDEDLTEIRILLPKLTSIYKRILGCFRYSLYSNISAIFLIIILEYVNYYLSSYLLLTDIIKFFIIIATMTSIYCIIKNSRRTKLLYLFDIEEEIKKGKKGKIVRKEMAKNLLNLIEDPDKFKNILQQNKKNKVKDKLSNLRKKISEVWDNLFS